MDGAFARCEGSEALFMCKKCHVTLKFYVSPDKSNFFRETRKMLI